MRAVLVALLLTACGGSSPVAIPAANEATFNTPTTNSSLVTVPLIAPSASQPEIPTPPVAISWVEVWREDWPSLRLAGWTNGYQANPCDSSEADPGTYDKPASSTANDSWATVGWPKGATVAGSRLLIDDTQTSMGWALLSGSTFDHTRSIKLTGVVELQPDAGAWIGLTLHHGEGDYRELSIYEDSGRLKLGTWAPCFIRWGLANVPNGPRKLVLEYTPPPALICWRYYLDELLVLSERCDDRASKLDGPPRVGLFAVNLFAESKQITSRLRATVGTITVEVGK